MGGVGVSRAVLKLFHRLKIIDDIRVLPIPIDMHGPQQPSFFIGDLYYLYYLSQLMIKFSFGSKLALELHPPSSLGIVWSQLEVVLRKIDQVAVPIDFLHLRAPAGRRCGASDRCYNWWTSSFSTQLQFFSTQLKRVAKTEANANTKRNTKQILSWTGSFSTSAGNRFKCCWASIEYRVAISD